MAARDKLQVCKCVKGDGVGSGLADIEDRNVYAALPQECAQATAERRQSRALERGADEEGQACQQPTLGRECVDERGDALPHHFGVGQLQTLLVARPSEQAPTFAENHREHHQAQFVDEIVLQ